jgi:hypothetical protein
MLIFGGLDERHVVTVEFGYQLSFCSRTEENVENLDKVGQSQDFPDAY